MELKAPAPPPPKPEGGDANGDGDDWARAPKLAPPKPPLVVAPNVCPPGDAVDAKGVAPPPPRANGCPKPPPPWVNGLDPPPIVDDCPKAGAGDGAATDPGAGSSPKFSTPILY